MFIFLPDITFIDHDTPHLFPKETLRPCKRPAVLGTGRHRRDRESFRSSELLYRFRPEVRGEEGLSKGRTTFFVPSCSPRQFRSLIPLFPIQVRNYHGIACRKESCRCCTGSPRRVAGRRARRPFICSLLALIVVPYSSSMSIFPYLKQLIEQGAVMHHCFA